MAYGKSLIVKKVSSFKFWNMILFPTLDVHPHEPRVQEICHATYQEICCKMIKETPELSIRQVHSKAISEIEILFGQEAMANLKHFNTTKHRLYKLKRLQHSPDGHHTPDSVRMVIPDDLRKLANGEDFLLADKTISDGRVLIFGTTTMLQKVCSKESVLYADGTFKACPRDFAQLFTIHVEVSNYVVPAFYCLMTSRTAAMYTLLLETIRDELAPSK